MSSIQQKPVHGLRRPVLRSSLAAVALLGLLMGCVTSGEGVVDSEDSVEPAEPSAPEVPLGYEWTEVLFTDSFPPGVPYGDKSFSAGGTLWLYDRKRAMTLYGTKDGKTWRTVDAAVSGLPATDGEFRSDCDSIYFGNLSSPTFTVLYHTHYGQNGPGLIHQHPWILDIGPESVSLSDGEFNGLTVVPPPEGGRTYYPRCAVGMEELGGKRVLVGTGNWGSNVGLVTSQPFVAIEDSAGSWKVHASREEPFFKDTTILKVMKAVDRLIVFAKSYTLASEFEVWSSVDGLSWDHIEYPGPPSDFFSDGVNASSNEYGIAMWVDTKVGEETLGYVWVSRDGLTWNHTKLLDSGWKFVTVKVDETGFVAYAARSVKDAGWDSGEWHSNDGVSWAEVENTNPQPLLLGDAIPYDGGLVVVRGYRFLVSGLPSWGAP